MTSTSTAPPAAPCACQLPPPAERRTIRQTARLSLAEVARRVGVDTMTVSRWERGVHEPQHRHVAPYQRLLELLSAGDARARAQPLHEQHAPPTPREDQ